MSVPNSFNLLIPFLKGTEPYHAYEIVLYARISLYMSEHDWWFYLVNPSNDTDIPSHLVCGWNPEVDESFIWKEPLEAYRWADAAQKRCPFPLRVELLISSKEI